MSTDKPRASVDSGTLLIIDPCYLHGLLNLTPEQEEAWKTLWFAASDKKGPVVQLSDGKFKQCGLILNEFGGDGCFTAEEIVHFLQGGTQFDFPYEDEE